MAIVQLFIGRASVEALGYLRVLINGVWIGLLFVSLAAAAAWSDKRPPTNEPAHPRLPAAPTGYPPKPGWTAADR